MKFAGRKGVLWADTATGHGAPVAGIKIFQLSTGRQIILNQHRAQSKVRAPDRVNEQVVFPYDTQAGQAGGIFQIDTPFFHLVREWLRPDPVGVIQPPDSCATF